MMSGARRGTSRGSAMMRFFPSDSRASSGKQSLPAGDTDELGDPGDAADLRAIPLLEVDPRPARQSPGGQGNRRKIRNQLLDEPLRLRLAADHAAQGADHAQDVGDAAVIEDVHFDALADERGGDVRLQVGESQHEVGLQGDDPIDLGARERRDARLLAPRPWRPHGEARDADDAPVLRQEVERLGRLLGQADDAVRKVQRCVHGRSFGVSLLR
jgi:hypothetical protein